MGNGWAYIDCSEFATGSGPTGSVQFHVEGTAISGSKHFMFHTAAYGAHPPNSLILSGNMSITGTLSASVINYENITVIDATGSTYFGNTDDDIHARTGSLRASTLSTPVLWTTASANGATPYVGIGTAAPSHTLTVAGTLSGSSTLHAVGAATLGSTLAVSGTTTLKALTATTISGSSTLQIVGDVGFGDNLNVTGAISGSNSLEVVGTIESVGNIASSGSITAGTSFIIGSADMNETDLEKLDGITNGTAAANKAVVVDGSKNIATLGTVGCGAITSTGASTYGSLAGGTLSGSSTLQIVGAGSFGSSVSATGSISGSSTLQAVGATTLGSTLNVSGNTGIGTDATGGILLHVSASTGALFQIDATSGSVPSANAPILYVTGGAVGKVGIGTQTPTAQLAVNGALHVTGSILPGADNSHDLGSSAMRWANVYTGDLHLANDRGDWTVIEEENYLTIRSNKTGKRFKLLMEEIED